jgi:peroxiredoxin
MRMLRSYARLALMGLALIAAHVSAALRVGEPAPDFQGMDTQGTTHRLMDCRGQAVVLEWTNHDCPYVRKHYGAGNMQAQQREAAERGVVWLSVISSAPGKQGHVSPAQADGLTESRDAAPRAVILDPTGEIGRAYGAKTTPHMYIVDETGTLVYQGGIDSIASADASDIPRATQYVRSPWRRWPTASRSAIP